MGFIGWLVGLLAKLGLDAWLHRGPSQIMTESEKAGTLQADLATAQKDVAAEMAMADAEANAPRSQADVVVQLRKGQF